MIVPLSRKCVGSGTTILSLWLSELLLWSLLILFKVLKKHWFMAKAVELTDVYELCIHSALQLSASVQMVSEEKHRGCRFVQNFGLALRSGRESWEHPWA